MSRKRRTFTPQFKLDALRLLESSGKPISQVARELGIRAELLYDWRRLAEDKKAVQAVSAKAVEPSTAEEIRQAEEIRRLTRRLEQIEQERDFLKKAAAYFAQES